jgi:hypothetical protein
MAATIAAHDDRRRKDLLLRQEANCQEKTGISREKPQSGH